MHIKVQMVCIEDMRMYTNSGENPYVQFISDHITLHKFVVWGYKQASKGEFPCLWCVWRGVQVSSLVVFVYVFVI